MMSFNATVKDLGELRTRYPVEVRRYATPLIEMIAGKNLLWAGRGRHLSRIPGDSADRGVAEATGAGVLSP